MTGYLDFLTKESTAAVAQCENNNHCYHQGTAWDIYYCCRCGQREPQTMAEKLNFYRGHSNADS